MTVKDSDKFLVTRSKTSYSVETQNLMAELKDDDLMMVSRGGQAYKATGKDIKDSLKPSNKAPVLDSVSLVEDNPGKDPRFTDQEFVGSASLSDDGIPASTKTFDAYVEGKITATPLTSEIASSTWNSNTATVVFANATGLDEFEAGDAVGLDKPVRWSSTISGKTTRVLNFGDTVPYPLMKTNLFTPVQTNDYVTFNNTADLQNSPNNKIFGGLLRGLSKIEYTLENQPGGGESQMVLRKLDGTYFDTGSLVFDKTGTFTHVFPQGDYSGGWIQASNRAYMNIKDFRQNSLDSNGNYNLRRMVEYDAQVLEFPDASALAGLAPGDVIQNRENGSTATVYEVIGNQVTIYNEVGVGGFNVGDEMNGVGVNDPKGTVQSTNIGLKQMLITTSDEIWTPGSKVKGPLKTLNSARRYLKFDSFGNVTDLISEPQSPSYTTLDSNPVLKLLFPSTFPSGNAPDDELGEGVTLTVKVTASNTAGSSGPLQASVQPEAPIDPPIAALNGLTTVYTGVDYERDIVNGIDFVNNNGLVWLKALNGSYSHYLYDTTRNIGAPLASSSADGERNVPGVFKGWNSNGFRLAGSSGVNASNGRYAAWAFQESTGYFDIVNYTGTGSLQNIPHQLGTKPGMIIVKCVSSSADWAVYHQSFTATSYIKLNSTGGVVVNPQYWNNTEPTDTQFTVNTVTDVNYAGSQYIAYLFADTPSLIKCGSYVGSGDTSQVVDVGFKPQWILNKNYSENTNWVIMDSERGLDSTGVTSFVYPNSDRTEVSDYNYVQATDNGFTFPVEGLNLGGSTYLYVAIAEPPSARSLTQEEYAEQALKFATYSNRKATYQGEEAMAAREALIAKLREQGYTDEQIKTGWPSAT